MPRNGERKNQMKLLTARLLDVDDLDILLSRINFQAEMEGFVREHKQIVIVHTTCIDNLAVTDVA